MPRTILFICVVGCALFALRPGVAAQSTPNPAQNTPPPEVARIDQLVKENRALMAAGKFDDIFAKAEEALSLAQKIGDKGRQSRALSQFATAAFHTGRTNLSIEKFKEAALLAEQAGDRNLQSLSLNSAGVLLLTAGEYEEAAYFYNQSLALRRQANDRRGEAYVLQQMSPIYMDTGDYEKAGQLLQEALQIARELKASGKEDRQLEDFILLRISWLDFLRGNYASALTAVQSAIANETERTSGANRWELRERLGLIYLTMRDYEKAAAAYAEAVELARRYKIAQADAGATGYLGWSLFKLGKPREAIDLLSQALAQVRQAGNVLYESLFLHYLAQVHKALGENEVAAANYRQAVAAIERNRSRSVPTELSKGMWVATRQDVFTGAIDLLVNLGRESEAFEVAEAYHARAFLDVLAESRIDLRKELSVAQRQREETLFKRIADIQKEWWKPTAKGREPQLQAELEKAEQELEEFQLELRRHIPRYASVTYPPPIKPERIARDLLDADTALIEYVLSDNKSFAWVIHQGRLTAVALPPRKEIESAVSEYRAALSEKLSALTVNRAIADINGKGRALYQKLLAPLETRLSSAKKLIIVADGALLYLPFEALAREVNSPAAKGATTEYLIERFAISYAPSATALAAINEVNKTSTGTAKGVIAFGDPVYAGAKTDDKEPVVAASRKPGLNHLTERSFDFKQLPYTRDEVNAIASLFAAAERRTFLGAEAREEQVKTADLSRYRYVHFAAHGLIDEEHPARSGIVLSAPGESKEDSVLQVGEVVRLKLNADLVTLSACRTGLGKLLNGEGMIGLTRAFLYAGADSVVVSLWGVNDLATAELMKAFYRNLKQGAAKDEALRQAKLSLIKGKRNTWRHPYFWAPFVLTGERE